MAYRVQIKESALKALKRLPRPIHVRAWEAISDLADDPRPRGCRKLAGEEDLWRIRIGNYRVVYQVLDAVLIVLVVRIAHRREVYR
ncbi:MAG: type II toxin-antitoxin system RelE/ParE family toxin [Deltaproteobacteria bacterium]|nr:type II toxin-antitoxin system RelE/ParE family toxin [Deltaproteobacteria bacterium]